MTTQDFPSLIDAQFATRFSEYLGIVKSDEFWSSWQYFDAVQYGD
jgi:hypothetical protein